MKKFLLSILILLLIGGYAIGNYFVDYALGRGINGEPPEACVSIHDSSRQVPAQPAAINEQWQIQSTDNLKLVATHFFPAETSHKWIILVHGYGRDQRYVWDYVDEYLKRGFNVLTPDMRAAGNSEGKYLTMSTLESADVALWTHEVVKHDSNAEIILHGISMGAATVLMTAARTDCANLKAVIEDCGYTSAYEMFSDQLGILFNLPAFPIMNCVDVVSKFKTDVYLSDAAPIEAVPNIKVPVLFIHGDADKLVSVEMMNRLFDASTTKHKDKLIVADAGHGDSMVTDTNAYFNKIFDFLNQI